MEREQAGGRFRPADRLSRLDRQPQDIPSDEVLTLSKAILRAGGFTDFADKHNVKITRQGSAGESDKVTLVVDVGEIFDKGKTENDVALKPGDLIYIPERMIRF